MESRSSGGLTAAVVIGVLVAGTWITNLQSERADLRESLALASEDASDSAQRVVELEEQLTRAERRAPRIRDRAYSEGRSDGIAHACDATYGTGPTLEGVVLRDGSIGDTWSRSYGEFAIIRAVVVVVSLEDGSSYRISRADCRRLT